MEDAGAAAPENFEVAVVFLDFSTMPALYESSLGEGGAPHSRIWIPLRTA